MKNLNLLIVEDEKFTQELLQNILTDYFNQVFTALNGIEALKIIKKEKIDIIITDIDMPKMDGIEMAKEIKKTNPFIPIIATTAYDDKNLLKELINNNFEGYFQKPLDINVIIKKLKEISESKKFNFYKYEYIESLTKCKNKKFFHYEFEKIVINSKSLYLIFMDLNRFKEINDNYGHIMGDKILKEFSKRILKSIRKNDICIRFGGDEFIVLIKNENNIDKILKRLIKNCNFLFNDIEISASIGAAHYPKNTNNPKELLNLADKAMYKSKKENLPFCLA